MLADPRRKHEATSKGTAIKKMSMDWASIVQQSTGKKLYKIAHTRGGRQFRE